jgi:hypothetical protein
VTDPSSRRSDEHIDRRIRKFNNCVMLQFKKGGKVALVVGCCFILFSQGCAHFPFSSARYAELYIRALDADGFTDVGAKIYLGDTGQVLTTDPTPTAVHLERKDGWYPGQIVYLVLDAPCYRASIHLVLIRDNSANRPNCEC